MDRVSIVLRRIPSAFLTVFMTATAIFFVTHVIGNPIGHIAGGDIPQDQMDVLAHKLGLDKSVWDQYVDYLNGVVHGDLGRSFENNRPATTILLERLPASVELTVSSMILSVLIALPLGILSAIRPGTWIDSLSRFGAVVGRSIPEFWAGILLILFFGVYLGVLPTGGRGDLQHLILPAFALTTTTVPLTMRLTRSALLEVLRKDYIKVARAKGASEFRVILNHAFRNAMIPVITVLTVRIGAIITGVVVVESVFSYPGVGSMGLSALRNLDYPVLQTFVVFVTLTTVVLNLIADVLYTIVDPRVGQR
jgi:peptide/nickel transport system permease protein